MSNQPRPIARQSIAARSIDTSSLSDSKQARQWSSYFFPGVGLIVCIIAMLLHGPIAQFADYHHFADQRRWLGIAHAADVLSNLGFAAVGLYGWIVMRRARFHPGMQNGINGYRLLFVSLLLTAIGSGWCHLSPDNARLVFDRLPIALACGAMLAAVWNETIGCARSAHWSVPMMAILAVASVVWWRYTDLHGVGDLRPYLLLQILPLVLIPTLQYQARRPATERIAFGIAIALYGLAKLCELADHALFDTLGLIGGHSLKHLLATLAAFVIARHLSNRVRNG